MGVPAKTRYGALYQELKNSYRPYFYAICNWGNENVTDWAPSMAQSWRTTVDVHVGEYKGNSFYQVQANFLRNQKSREKAGVGHWNDPDMLLIGRAPDMTMEQMKTHYALWAFAKAPLIISVDVNTLGDKSDPNSLMSMLQNKALIAINQDQNQQQCEEIENPNSTGANDHLGFYKTLVLE